MKRSTKRLLSALICLAMVLVMLPVAAFAAENTTIYCQSPEGWTGCNVYWWGSSAQNPSWPGVAMSQDSNGIWTIDVPSDATGLVLNDGNGTQSLDQKVPVDENNMYVFEKQYWTVYGKVPITTEYFVAGVAALCGVDWQPGAVQNKMSENGDGTYSITYTGVAAGSYELKVTTGSWASCWGEEGTSNNYVVTVADNDSTVVISFDPATKLVNAEVNPVISTDEVLISEGTVTYATDLDARNAEAITFIPAQDGTVTVDISTCNPGFYLDVYQDGEWINEYYDSAAQKIDISVAAGSFYEFLISSAVVYSPAIYEMKAGSVTYKITADVVAGELNQGGDEPGEGGENSETNPQPITSYYGNYIDAGQTMWFVYDNSENMLANGIYSQMLHMSAGVPYSVTYRGMDVPVDAEGFVVYEMMDVVYQGMYVFSVTNNSDYNAYFTIEVKDRPEYVISEIMLNVGDNVVLPDPEFSKTLYRFEPSETGVYKFTISDGLIGNWGSYFNPIDNTGTNATVLEWTCTAVGQSIMIGVTETEEAVLTVAKTDNYVAKDQAEETHYDNTYGFTYQLPENPDLVAIDVLDDVADVAVLDKDGFYRYGSKYGPLMVADLNQFPVNLADAYLNGQLKAYVYNANGELVARYDYNDAMYEYLEAGLVPVTAELATMVKQIGNHHGWWQAGGFVFENDAPADESTAWMVACSWMKGSELDPESEKDDQENNNSGNTDQGGNKPEGGNQDSTNGNPKTTDISMAWSMMAMVMAGICLIVLKKKEDFFLN